MAGQHGDQPGDSVATHLLSTRRWDPPVSAPFAAEIFPEWLDNRRYRRESRLGRGGMGVVYGYRDPRLDRLVAVKSLPGNVAHDPAWRAMFEHEARVLASLDHPNIGRIHHIAEHEGLDFLILEYVPGRTLDRWIRVTPNEFDPAISIAVQIGRAIEAGHAAGIMHRDVKPGNVMVTPGLSAKLLDFGLAAATPSSEGGRNGAAAESEGRAVGTPGYMSPEQACGEAVDERTDVWAFGCVLYECLAARPAFPGQTREARIAATLETEPDWGRLPPNTPREVVEVVEGCLCKDREHRPASMGEIIDALERVDQSLGRRSWRGTVANNLPTPPTSYVERAGETACLTDYVTANRLVTLTGPGGCGKTRLAVNLGRRLQSATDEQRGGAQFPDGIWLVELAAITSADLVPRGVASALWTDATNAPDTGRTTMAELLEDLRERRLLIILDNCEHLVDGCRTFATDLLQRCPEIRIIATSREHLGVAGEQIYNVPELSYPSRGGAADPDRHEAVRLFVERARLVRPDFEFTDDVQRPVAEICARLEGIPLAIELAAARVRSLPVAEIARRLMDMLERESALEWSIRSSVDLLEPAQRTMLGQLAVFHGGWTLEAAEAVCAGGERSATRRRPVIDLLSDLVARSLVLYEVRNDRARYHLLETVRQYCAHHLAPKRRDERRLRQAHARCLLEVAEELFKSQSGPEQAACYNRIEIEHENYRAAIRWCLGEGDDPDTAARIGRDLHMFWYNRGHLAEGRAALEEALARRQGQRDAIQMRAASAAGTIAGIQREFDAARRHYEDALDIAESLDEKWSAAGILTNLGILCERFEEFDRATEYHRRALAVYETLDNGAGIAAVQLNLAFIERLRGRFDAARELLGACLAFFEQAGDFQRLAAAHQDLGEIARLERRSADAERHLAAALERRHELGIAADMANSIRWLGIVAADCDEPERAVRLFGVCETIDTAHGLAIRPTTKSEYERAFAHLADVLDDATIERCRAEGRALELDGAVDLALRREASTIEFGEA